MDALLYLYTIILIGVLVLLVHVKKSKKGGVNEWPCYYIGIYGSNVSNLLVLGYKNQVWPEMDEESLKVLFKIGIVS